MQEARAWSTGSAAPGSPDWRVPLRRLALRHPNGICAFAVVQALEMLEALPTNIFKPTIAEQVGE